MSGGDNDTYHGDSTTTFFYDVNSLSGRSGNAFPPAMSASRASGASLREGARPSSSASVDEEELLDLMHQVRLLLVLFLSYFFGNYG